MDAMKDALRKKRMDGMAVTILIGKPGEEGEMVGQHPIGEQESDLAPEGEIPADPLDSKVAKVDPAGAPLGIMEDKPSFGEGAGGLRKRMQDALSKQKKV